MRITLFAVLGVVLAGCGSSSGPNKPNTPTLTVKPPTIQPRPPSTQTSTAGPLALMTQIIRTTPVPLPASGPSTAVPPPSNPLTADPAVVKAHGYTPDSGHTETPDGFGHTLYAWRATCTDSADGYCQKVFFFIGTRYLGTDTRDPSTQIVGINAPEAGTIAVSYAHYLAGDAQCCPSGQPVLISYHWNGSRLIPSEH